MKVVLFYGTDCNENTAWFPWLKSQLEMQKVDCFIPCLPTPENQSYQTWSKIVEKIEINSDDIVIGWSTGAIFAVRYLFEHNISVKKLILVSGFNNYIGNVPRVDNINKTFFINSLEDVKKIANEIVCFKSDNDPFITQEALSSFAKGLKARVKN
ncbi:MAG: alpha/beta hydrolase, partial [Clostridia bacterium]|nr:alpha/beta hydrolase [Clostridia bacterium]